MPTKWWITRTNEHVSVPDGENFLDIVERSPSQFGTTAHDIEFAKQKGEDGRLALMDQLCWDKIDEGGLPGSILIEQTPVGLDVQFWAERSWMYERLMYWLSLHYFLPDTYVRMIEIGQGRRWRTTVGSIHRGAHYSKNPDKGGGCPRCGSQISWSEILERGVCPKCGEKLT